MNMLNSIIVEGTLKEVKFLGTEGVPIMKVVISTERFYRNRKNEGVTDVSDFTVESYGTMADVLSKHCDKGQGLRVVGRLKQNKWESEGKEMSEVVIVAEHIEFKPKKLQKEAKDEK